MIRGLHGLFFSNQPEELRAFFRDKLQLPFNDVGEGWLIFDVPEADLGVHPTEDAHLSGRHNLSFYCDDLEGTVAELKQRGVTFNQEIEEHSYGLVTYFSAPGGVQVQLYQPRYTKRRKGASAPARKAPARRGKPVLRPAKKSRR